MVGGQNNGVVLNFGTHQLKNNKTVFGLPLSRAKYPHAAVGCGRRPTGDNR